MKSSAWIAVAGALFSAALGAGACSSGDTTRLPPPPGCTSKCSAGAVAGASQAASTGSGTTSGTGGSGGNGMGVAVTGTVQVVDSPDFSQSKAYTGAATIETPMAGGGTASALYGGMAGATFSLSGVAAGTQWMYVHDETGSGNVLSTFSPQALPPSAPLVLPVIDKQTMQTLVGMLPVMTTISDSQAQVILFVEQNAQPLVGAKVVSGSAGATIAYDQGVGVYSTDAKATGSAGVVLLINATASPAGGTLAVGMIDANGAALPVINVPIASGSASYAHFTL